jgi:hypothetical protein
MWFRHEPHSLRGETVVVAGDLIRCSAVGERSLTWTTTFTHVLLALQAWSVQWELAYCNVVHTGSAVGCCVLK